MSWLEQLGPGARGALEIPDEHIVCPFTPVLAFATQAVLAGVDLRRNERVTGTERLYVCDMSIMPFSSAANPVRTLVALALRLAQKLG